MRHGCDQAATKIEPSGAPLDGGQSTRISTRRRGGNRHDVPSGSCVPAKSLQVGDGSDFTVARPCRDYTGFHSHLSLEHRSVATWCQPQSKRVSGRGKRLPWPSRSAPLSRPPRLVFKQPLKPSLLGRCHSFCSISSQKDHQWFIMGLMIIWFLMILEALREAARVRNRAAVQGE